MNITSFCWIFRAELNMWHIVFITLEKKSKIFLKNQNVAGSLPYKSRYLGIKISHGCREIAFCPVGYFNLSHPVYLTVNWVELCTVWMQNNAWRLCTQKFDSSPSAMRRGTALLNNVKEESQLPQTDRVSADASLNILPLKHGTCSTLHTPSLITMQNLVAVKVSNVLRVHINQSINQSININQFNSNLAAREPDSKWYAVEIIDKTANETNNMHLCT